MTSTKGLWLRQRYSAKSELEEDLEAPECPPLPPSSLTEEVQAPEE